MTNSKLKVKYWSSAPNVIRWDANMESPKGQKRHKWLRGKLKGKYCK